MLFIASFVEQAGAPTLCPVSRDLLFATILARLRPGFQRLCATARPIPALGMQTIMVSDMPPANGSELVAGRASQRVPPTIPPSARSYPQHPTASSLTTLLLSQYGPQSRAANRSKEEAGFGPTGDGYAPWYTRRAVLSLTFNNRKPTFWCQSSPAKPAPYRPSCADRGRAHRIALRGSPRSSPQSRGRAVVLVTFTIV